MITEEMLDLLFKPYEDQEVFQKLRRILSKAIRVAREQTIRECAQLAEEMAAKPGIGSGENALLNLADDLMERINQRGDG